MSAARRSEICDHDNKMDGDHGHRTARDGYVAHLGAATSARGTGAARASPTPTSRYVRSGIVYFLATDRI